jgi:hypothetical protein
MKTSDNKTLGFIKCEDYTDKGKTCKYIKIAVLFIETKQFLLRAEFFSCGINDYLLIKNSSSTLTFKTGNQILLLVKLTASR